MLKGKDQRDKERYDKAMLDAVDGIPAVAGKWRHFCETLHFKDEVPLVQRIQAFSMPASKWAHDKYPSLSKTKNPIPWFVMLFSGVRSAGTHTDAELNKAMDDFAAETQLPPLHDLVNLLPKMPPN